MAVRWNGLLGEPPKPDLRGKVFMGLGISLPNQTSCMVVGAVFINPADLETLADDYIKEFGAPNV